MSLAILTPLLLAGAALPAADSTAIEARVKAMFRPYSLPSTSKSAWEYPIFSAETAALIAHWQRVLPKDEPDALDDGDWFCLCQDFDQKAFRAVPGAAQGVAPGVVEVQVRLDLGFGETRNERLVFKKEANGWRLDDLFAADDFPRGLKQKLRETIAEDEALKRP
jgi:hypothetical protein